MVNKFVPINNFKLSGRSKRFINLWFVNFCFYLGALVLAICIGGLIGYLIILAAHKYSAIVVFLTLVLGWALILVAVVAGAVAEQRLLDQEYKERELLEAMKYRDLKF